MQKWGVALHQKCGRPSFTPPLTPPEYLQLLAEMKAQYERCAAIAARIMETGVGDPQLYMENARMREIDERLQALRRKLGLIDQIGVVDSGLLRRQASTTPIWSIRPSFRRKACKRSSISRILAFSM